MTRRFLINVAWCLVVAWSWAIAAMVFEMDQMLYLVGAFVLGIAFELAVIPWVMTGKWWWEIWRERE